MGVAFFIVAESDRAVKFPKRPSKFSEAPKQVSRPARRLVPAAHRLVCRCVPLGQPIATRPNRRADALLNMPVQKLGELGLADRPYHLVDHLPVLE